MVLEARENAETVWYSVIWEKEKDASNVVDYDIHDEITIDTSSVFNANNDTTTGMANVIPWINAPKLLMWTSIYEPTPAERTVEQTMKWYSTWIYRPDTPTWAIRNFTTSSSTGKKSFIYYSSPEGNMYSWMQAPYTWTYSIQAKYIGTASNYHYIWQWRTAKWWYPDDDILHTTNWNYSSSEQTETFSINLNKWDCLWIFVTMEKSTSAYYSETPRVEMTITKTA